jgi:uncharacterized protein (DUF2267 family)
MSHTETGIDVIEKTIQKTNAWIKETETGLGIQDRHYALQAIRAVSQILRDHLPIAVAIHLGDQLPTLIRGFYYENWSPTHERQPILTAEDFLGLLAAFFPKDYDVNALRMARTVFTVLKIHIAEGQVQIIRNNLPAPIAAIWN